MAKIRKWVAYRRLERPYTRISKFREKAYIRITPHVKIAKFDMGNLKKRFDYYLHLVSKTDLQIRDNAIESARQVGNRMLEKNLAKNEYFFQTKVYPHHILRENPLAAGAGADRMSTGMAHSFGKVMGIAAQVKKNAPIFTVKVDKQNLDFARRVLRRASTKLPCSCSLILEKTK